MHKKAGKEEKLGRRTSVLKTKLTKVRRKGAARLEAWRTFFHLPPTHPFFFTAKGEQRYLRKNDLFNDTVYSRILKKCKICLAKLKVIYNLQTVTN